MLPLLSIGLISVLLIVACGGSEPTQLATPTVTLGTTPASAPAATQTSPVPSTAAPQATSELPQAPRPTAIKTAAEEQFSHLEIVTILPPDGIRSINNPRFMTNEQAREEYGEPELVIGLSINGDHWAYSVPFLSGREIVNDVVGGVPVAVTW